MNQLVPAELYRGECLSFPGPWAFQISNAAIRG